MANLRLIQFKSDHLQPLQSERQLQREICPRAADTSTN